MKFLKAKKDTLVCRYCKTNILRGEDMVLTFISFPAFRRTSFYHAQCYPEYFKEMYLKKWNEWKLDKGNNSQLHFGRPVKYQNPTKEILLRRLTSLLSYHKKLFHGAKIEQIKKQIEELSK